MVRRSRPGKRFVPALAVMAGTLLLVVGGAALALGALGALRVQGSEEFPAELRITAPTVEVELPPAARIGQFVVSAGERVRSGQVLAVLDLAAIEREQERVGDRLSEIAARLDCLERLSARLGAPGEGAGGPVAEASVVADGIAPGVDCGLGPVDLVREKGTQARLALITARARHFALLRRLYARHAALLARANRAAGGDRLRRQALRQALRAALAGLAETVTLEDRARIADELELHRARLTERVEALRASLRAEQRELRRKAQHLERLRARPRLHAPAAGEVMWLRPPARATATEPLVVGEIRMSGPETETVRVRLPRHALSRIRDGEPVEIRLPFLPRPQPVLRGRISLFPNVYAQEGEAEVVASVHLAPEARARLVASRSPLARARGGTVAEARVRLAARPLLALLAEEVGRARQQLVLLSGRQGNGGLSSAVVAGPEGPSAAPLDSEAAEHGERNPSRARVTRAAVLMPPEG